MSWLFGSVAERDYVAVNRAGWTRSNAEYTDRAAHDTWAQEEITWGQWSKPEREVQILPDVTGKDVVELGCGTAYFGAWLKRAGARRVVGIDVTPAQLETARRMDEEFGLGLELIEANAEDVPLPDDSFDVAFSENQLGQDLTIRRFSPTAQKVFNLIPSDVGRRITDFRLKIDLPDLEPLIVATLDTPDVLVRQLVRAGIPVEKLLILKPSVTVEVTEPVVSNERP